MNQKKLYVCIVLLLCFFLVGCDPSKQNQSPLRKVRIMLDWASNTNHTGLFVARAKGYFTEKGLDVEIIQPSGTDPLAVVATQKADLGVSSQEGVIQARAQGLPVVSIAAIIQHNTSGFASLKEKGITRPRHFEHKTFGGFGFPVEKEMVESVMEEDRGDPRKAHVVYTGNINFFTAIQRNVDFMWIYYGWTGIEAKVRGIPINMIYLTDYSKDLDYYTPLLITNEKVIKQDPSFVRMCMEAINKGYEYAIRYPREAAQILLHENPGLDPKLVYQSQLWLSPRYQDGAKQWGIQKIEVWESYTSWLKKHQLLEKGFRIGGAYTNRFLPER